MARTEDAEQFRDARTTERRRGVRRTRALMALALGVFLLAAAVVYARNRPASLQGVGAPRTPERPHTHVTAAIPGRTPTPQGTPSVPRIIQGDGTGPSIRRARRAWPLPGRILIADKGNNRLILVGPRHHISWRFPRPGDLPPGVQFLIPDDAFFSTDHRTIMVTEEDFDVIREIDVQTRRIIWQYGHPGIPGSAPGYLNGPDDAYLLPSGLTSVADIRNCRILLIRHNGTIARQYGTTGACYHNPPYAFASPNGDTPLPDGGMLISEIGGSWIDRLDARGRLVWSVRSPALYPSDPQILPFNRTLVSDYSLPGAVFIMGRRGHVVARFGDASGPHELNHPSLAIRLPNGLIALNDDWNHRVIIVNMRRRHIVWQYGVTGYYGHRPGYLNTPDGIDFLPG